MSENKNTESQHQTRVNVWKKDFVLAIKNNNESKLDELLDESDEYFQGYMLSPSMDFNVLKNSALSSKEKGSIIRKLQQEDLENNKNNILKQSRENLKYILKIMHDDEKNDFINKCGEEQIYANSNFSKICETPILLSILCPFELSGIFIFCLLHEDKDLKFQVPPALFNLDSPLNSDSSNYYEHFDKYHYKYSIFFGSTETNEKYSYAYKLKDILNFNVNNWQTNTGSDGWNLLEMLYYVDRSCYKQISKSRDTKPLFHIIGENEQYWQTLNEFTKGLNPYSIKYLIFKTLIFYKVFKDGSCSNLFFTVADFIDGDNNITNSINACWTIPYITGDNNITNSIIAHWILPFITLKDAIGIYIIIDRHKKLVNNITLKNLDKSEDDVDKSESDVDNKSEDLFTECLWKLILYDQICIKNLRKTFIKFIHSRTSEQYKSIRNIMLPLGKQLVRLNDWNGFYHKYENDLKIIFPKLTDKELMKLWEVACKNVLFIFPNYCAFDFNKKRLNNSSNKKIDPKEYKDIEVEAISVVTLMEIANISNTMEPTQKSSIDFLMPLKRFGKNPPYYSVFKVMDNIHRYSSDPIVIFLREISNICAISHIFPCDDIKLLLAAYNAIVKSYELIFASEFYIQQSVKALSEYQKNVMAIESKMLSSCIPNQRKNNL